MKKRVVIFSGAGISKESGINTFRDSDGTWENYKVEDVATPHGWKKNKELVMEFYNTRRDQLKTVHPNRAHEICKELEDRYHVTIVTQNVDDLHERAGSSNIVHLHGNLLTLRSSLTNKVVVPWTETLTKGMKAPDGSQLRPNVVWFGESLNMNDMNAAFEAISQADAIIVVGTSRLVEPAASMPELIQDDCLMVYVDPSDNDFTVPDWKKPLYLKVTEVATTGMVRAVEFIDAGINK